MARNVSPQNPVPILLAGVYRSEVGVYKLTEDLRIPSGIALANPQAGLGGGFQYYIEDSQTKLKLIDKIDLN